MRIGYSHKMHGSKPLIMSKLVYKQKVVQKIEYRSVQVQYMYLYLYCTRRT